jgi:flagellar hook assembly protein FlgD
LQSQDPTNPMDPANMVSQMFSMNQLQQLININQTLTAAFPAETGSTSGVASSTNPTSGAN